MLVGTDAYRAIARKKDAYQCGVFIREGILNY